MRLQAGNTVSYAYRMQVFMNETRTKGFRARVWRGWATWCVSFLGGWKGRSLSQMTTASLREALHFLRLSLLLAVLLCFFFLVF